MESRGSLFAFLFVCVLFDFEVYGQVASLCRPNERFLSCGGCQKTCEEPSPVCAAVCREGCYCNDDEVRNSTGHCVKIADCPSVSPSRLHTSEPRSTDSSCPDNEEYRFCEPCNRTCDNLNPVCPAQCARGCFCKDDLVRDRDGRCVRAEECGLKKHENSNYIQKPIAYQMTCGPHQQYKDCQKCELTCSSPNPVCVDSCRAGCFCEDGYIRAPSGKCVKLEECPKAEVTMGAHETSVEDCSNDEVYLSCGWCEPSCWDPRPVCPPGVCTRGCLCRPPLLRHHSGHCVEDRLCEPQKCTDPGEEFVCRYGCEARCDNRKCPSRPRRCVLGCHCKLGLLRDANFRCVVPEQCSRRLNTFTHVMPLSFPLKLLNSSAINRAKFDKIDVIESFVPQPNPIEFLNPFRSLLGQSKTKIIDLKMSPKAFFEIDFIPELFKGFRPVLAPNNNDTSIFDEALAEMKNQVNASKILPDIKTVNTEDSKDMEEDSSTESTTMEPVPGIGEQFKLKFDMSDIVYNSMKKLQTKVTEKNDAKIEPSTSKFQEETSTNHTELNSSSSED